MTNKSNSENREPTVDDIINEVKSKSSNGDYIYRGERQPHCKVSSALYREYFDREDTNVNIEGFDLTIAQKEMLRIAKRHIGFPPKDSFEGFVDVKIRSITELTIAETLRQSIEKDEETEETEILTELQHYGGKTNLIDFTTDYLIAIFFACAGHLKEKGRVILLQKTKDIENMIIRPRNPRHRVIAQKSIFLHPPQGFIDVNEDDMTIIPAVLKKPLLKYLDKFHGISAETIYNDIHGFITNQNIQQNTIIQFYLGLTLQYRGYQAERGSEKQKAYNNTFAKLSGVELSRYLMNSPDRTKPFSDLINNNRFRFLRKYF